MIGLLSSFIQLALWPANRFQSQLYSHLSHTFDQVKNLNPLLLASPGTPSPILMAPSTTSPRSRFLFNRTRMKRRRVAMHAERKAMTQFTDMATTVRIDQPSVSLVSLQIRIQRRKRVQTISQPHTLWVHITRIDTARVAHGIDRS